MTTDALKPEKKGMPLLLKLVVGLCVLAAGIGIGIGIGAGIWEGSSSKASNNGSIVNPACQPNSTEVEWLISTPAERLFISTDSNKTDSFEANSHMFNIILSGVPDTVLAFTDRPVRRAQPLPTSKAVDVFNSDPEDSFNAVVTFKFLGAAVQIPIDMLSVVALGNNSYALNATVLQLPGPLANEADQTLLDATEFNSSNIQMVYDMMYAGYESSEDNFLFVDNYSQFGDLKVNASCDSNDQCANGACGRATAADDAPKVCCPWGGDTMNYGGFDYCANMPQGVKCWSDAMCHSGAYCFQNIGGIGKGTCFDKDPPGTKCQINLSCLNGACGRASADDGDLVCCPDGSEIDTFGGLDYCTNMKPGTACKSNAMCQNGQCGRPTAADGAEKVCCPDGSTAATYDGYDYCTNMPDGSTCGSDAQCGSGRCEGNGGGIYKGTCVRLRSAGEGCDSNGQCQNGACGRASADDDAPKVCCPYGGGVDTFGGFDYCTNMPPGTRCWSDAMCQNGNCKGNGYGVQRGNCN